MSYPADQYQHQYRSGSAKLKTPIVLARDQTSQQRLGFRQRGAIDLEDMN